MQLVLSVFSRGALPCASVDSDIAGWFRAHLTPTFADVLLGLSGPGSALCVASIIGLVVLWLVWKRQWVAAMTMVLTVGGGSFLGEGLKLLFQRQRPFLSGPFGAWGGYSFPSGHTIAATLLYGFLGLALYRTFKQRRWRWLSVAGAMILVVGVGFSRIALGAHYFTDVLGAMILGTAWIVLCQMCVNVLRKPPVLAVNLSPVEETVEIRG